MRSLWSHDVCPFGASFGKKPFGFLTYIVNREVTNQLSFKFGFVGEGHGLRRLKNPFENILATLGANSPAAKFARVLKNLLKL